MKTTNDLAIKEFGKYDNVYIYGAGNICKRLLTEIDEELRTMIRAVFVTNLSSNPEKIEGIPVIQYGKGKVGTRSAVIVAIYDYEEIFQKLNSELGGNVFLYSRIIPDNIGIDDASLKNYNREVENYYYKQQENNLLFRYVEIETVNRCNGECSFCPVNAHEKQREYHKMSSELFENIILQLASLEYDGAVALFSNNEPFLDERICEFAKFTKEKLPKAQIYLYTNGTLLSIEKFKEIIQHLDLIQIDNYDPQNGKHSNVIEIEKYVHDAGMEDRYRYFEIDKDAIRLSRGGNSPNSRVLYTLDARCSLPLIQMVIRPDGKVSLCCNDSLGEMTLGDLTMESITDIWNGDRYKAIRKSINDSRENVSICKYCNYVDRREIYSVKL